MADFSVEFTGVKNCGDNFKEMSNRLSSVAQESASIFIKLRTTFVSNHVRSIKSAEINWEINNCAEGLKKMANAVESAVATYQSYENKVLSGDVSATSNKAADPDKYKDYNFVKFSQFMSTTEALEDVNFKFLSRFGYAVSHIGILEFLKHTFGFEGYDDVIIENAIKDTIKRTQNIDTEVDSVELEAVSKISNYKDVLNFILISKNVSAERINKVLDTLDDKSIKNLGKLASTGKKGIEIVSYLLQDYSSAIEQLEIMRIRMITAGATEYVDCVNNVIHEYEHKMCTVGGDIFDEIADKGIDRVADAVSGGAYSAVKFAVRGVSDISGLTDYSESVLNLEMNDGYVNAVTQTYQHYANRLKMGDYNDNVVASCQESFIVAKAAQLNQLEDMAAVCKGDKLQKIKEQIDLLERTNWDGSVNPA